MERCGECDDCIEYELFYLSSIEGALFVAAEGDLTAYLNLMAEWIDLFNVRGGVLKR